LHCPLDITLETKLDPELRSWLAFAVQKLDEVATLARPERRQAAIQDELAASAAARHSRNTCKRIRNEDAASRREIDRSRQ
jgi:5-methyltetrahydropteroyltriglutamate--homocysteine methyltransferase